MSRNLKKSKSQLKLTPAQYNALTDDVILVKGIGDTEAVAIVIANDKYKNFPPLTGAVRDGAVVAESLKKLGFRVLTSYNKSKSELLSELNDLKRQLDEKTGILVVYYAGYAVEIDSNGYILAIDAPFPDSEQKVINDSIKVDEMIGLASKDKFATVLIFDASRDNPFRGTR